MGEINRPDLLEKSESNACKVFVLAYKANPVHLGS